MADGTKINPNTDPGIPAGDPGQITVTASTDFTAPSAEGGFTTLTGQINNARSQAVAQDAYNVQQYNDWRVRLALAPGASGYLYKTNDPGILAPLQQTDGIVFPYTPAIAVSYVANYDSPNLIHTNYKIVQYQSSAVENVTLTCDFTAQDTTEANYLLAVIHFLRSVTKMFYGQDENPKNGTPPPICYLYGLGAYQFDAHPLVINSFNYNLPTDVDYIRAGSGVTLPGVSKYAQHTTSETPDSGNIFTKVFRLLQGGNNIQPGGGPRPTQFSNPGQKITEPTYVPTKISIQIGALPLVSRNDISNNFSVKNYATGKLLRGSQNGNRGLW